MNTHGVIEASGVARDWPWPSGLVLCAGHFDLGTL